MKTISFLSLRHGLLSALLATGIISISAPAFAVDWFGSGWGSAINGQVGVSTHINNTPLYTPSGSDIDARNRQIYRNDAHERTIRQRAPRYISPADIAPAAGTPRYIKRSPVYDMGGIQGGHSYND